MIRLTKNRKQEAFEDLSKLEGLPPYDGGGNLCYADGYFANSIKRKFGIQSAQDWTALRQKSGIAEYAEKWQKMKDSLIKEAKRNGSIRPS